LIKIKIIILQTSILTGALFFWSGKIIAKDTLAVTNYTSITDSLQKVDSLKIQKKQTFNDNLNPKDSFNNEMKPLDSVKLKKERFPQKATIYSALLPGLGQAYNHKFWKIPIIYIGGGVIYYFYNDCNTKYKMYKRRYEEEVFKGAQGNADLKNNSADGRDYFRKWRDSNILFMGLLYTANIIDAMADAYFRQFDISDDLTMKVEPAMISTPLVAQGNFSYGLKISFSF
jgi:hypothetical protein